MPPITRNNPQVAHGGLTELGRFCVQVLRKLKAQPRRIHRCRQRDCRRQRQCLSPDFDCALVVLSREEQAETLARIRHLLGEEGDAAHSSSS